MERLNYREVKGEVISGTKVGEKDVREDGNYKLGSTQWVMWNRGRQNGR